MFVLIKPNCSKQLTRQYYLIGVQVGEVGEISITSSGSSESYFYAVMSKGKVVSSGSGVLSDGQAMFTVTITQDFTPQAYVVVYAVLAGELLADSFSFNIEGTFVNDVSDFVIEVSIF